MEGNSSGNGAVAIGLDGGAGALKFAIKPPSGEVKYYECAGANPALIGMDSFITRLSQAILDALNSAQCSADQVVSAGFGLSGVDRAPEIVALQKKIRMVLPRSERIWVGNDALPALRQGAGKLCGLVLIAGTGSICFAVASNGLRARVGGWGGELGDEGSGFYIGLRGLQAVCRMADGRVPRTSMVRKVLDKLGLAGPEELIPWSSNKSRHEFKNLVAALFPIVAEQATKGDPSAKQAILLGIGHLVQHVLAGERHLARLEKNEAIGADTMTHDGDITQVGDEAQPADMPHKRIDLVCAGGLFAKHRDFYDAFVYQLKRKRDVFNGIRLSDPPSLGALALGQEAEPVVAAPAV